MLGLRIWQCRSKVSTVTEENISYLLTACIMCSESKLYFCLAGSGMCYSETRVTGFKATDHGSTFSMSSFTCIGYHGWSSLMQTAQFKHATDITRVSRSNCDSISAGICVVHRIFSSSPLLRISDSENIRVRSVVVEHLPSDTLIEIYKLLPVFNT